MNSRPSLPLLLALTLTTACQGKDDFDREALRESARVAISYADTKAEELTVPRDPEALTDERILDETEEIADYAMDRGCDVQGALGGVWVEGGEPKTDDGGDLDGRWFDLAQEIGGDLAGTYTPDAKDPGAGAVQADWNDADALTGTLEGRYYASGDGDGNYLARYSSDDGSAQGVLGGLWYRNSEEGGMLFGVWGHCPEGVEEFEDESYVSTPAS